jgi:hypothetical protein
VAIQTLPSRSSSTAPGPSSGDEAGARVVLICWFSILISPRSTRNHSLPCGVSNIARTGCSTGPSAVAARTNAPSSSDWNRPVSLPSHSRPVRSRLMNTSRPIAGIGTDTSRAGGPGR